MKNQKGFIQLIIIIVIAILALNYFGFNVRDIFDSPQFKGAFDSTWNTLIYIWDTYLKGPAVYVWEVLWNQFKGSDAQ
ncbi:MAG: hypothetical protein AAB587_01025 [Patescibacteria group bacterium]